MVSIPHYLSNDEATVVLAALGPLHHRTFSYKRGAFGDFGKLPEEVRNAVNRAITEHRRAIAEFRVYSEPVHNADARHYVLGLGVNHQWAALNPPMLALTPHILELAKKST